MRENGFEGLRAEIAALSSVRQIGRIHSIEGALLRVSGLGHHARMGDQLRITRGSKPPLGGEVIKIDAEGVTVLPDEHTEGLALGDRVTLLGPAQIAPDEGWIGRVVDPYGAPLDGRPLMRGQKEIPLRNQPPAPGRRNRLGRRLETGVAVFNTILPFVEGQRIGLFAGSGVGKSSLLSQFARNIEADVVVIALIGERGRELRDFVSDTLGPEGMRRSIVVAATSDQSPLMRRRCAWSAMSIAEYFRDTGRDVLFLADSITRFADAHREVAVAGGELPSLRGYPASTSHLIMQLCERAGPGPEGAGAISAVFSVLVAGSDMDEPVADILRGVLDGHVVMDRSIAERGRYPAIDVLRSVSRSLPSAASIPENKSISEARRLLGLYSRNEMMIRAGLYTPGTDSDLDAAVSVSGDLEVFISDTSNQTISNSFQRLNLILRRAGAKTGAEDPEERRSVSTVVKK
ncbi:FliI/YscN family ATPase [Pseudooceanicola sp. C21-150M6]|uniref:FliI/YscN family ATPase n=1 Tax=Pseudooceanicola sp. C21-150M6 TaxID=3434355 RepID=UPI003D7F5162